MGGRMRNWLRSTLFSSLLVGTVAGCEAPLEPLADAPADIAISVGERPELLFRAASRRLVDNISADDIGKDFGLPSHRVPYPDTYWPYLQGGTDARWNPHGRDGRTPIEKYMSITLPHLTLYAKLWEYTRHGPGAHDVKPWCGHCGGWASAAMSEAPILHPVFATSDGRGGIAPCREGDFGCVRFEIGDLNALMAEIYIDGPTAGIGGTCNTPANAIPRDRFGRVLKSGCAGVNAGSLLVALATFLKRHRIPFAMSAQSPDKTDEIWNQPVYRYHVYDARSISRREAEGLIARGQRPGAVASYPWNRAARGFMFVDIGLRFVGEAGPNLLLRSGENETYEMRVAAVIELSADASQTDARILGGEYLDLPSSHAARLAVPTSLWVARGPGPERLPVDAGSLHHNPFILPSVVKRLIALGQR